MNETLLKDIYKEVVLIREKVEMLEEAIIPKESATIDEISEIHRLKEESLKGEHMEWKDLKKELSL